MPQNSNFRLPHGHRFRPKFDFTVMAPNHGGDPLGPILGPMGSHWVQNMGQNRKKLPCPQIRISTTPRSSISAKIRLYGYGTKSWWGPLGSILGPMVFHLVKKMGQNRKELLCLKISNFQLTHGHRFRPKFDFAVMMPNHVGYPLGSILGPMESHWVQNMGQNRKKLPCPKIPIFDYPAVIDFGQSST